jgi:cytolysin (calcineurin-like family phosphatase)
MLNSRPQTNTTTLFVEEKNYVENTHTRTVYIRNPWNPIALDNEHKRWKIVGAWGYYRL